MVDEKVEKKVPFVPLIDFAKPILVERCRKAGLTVTGTKAELARRLRKLDGTYDEVDELIDRLGDPLKGFRTGKRKWEV